MRLFQAYGCIGISTGSWGVICRRPHLQINPVILAGRFLATHLENHNPGGMKGQSDSCKKHRYHCSTGSSNCDSLILSDSATDYVVRYFTACVLQTPCLFLRLCMSTTSSFWAPFNYCASQLQLSTFFHSGTEHTAFCCWNYCLSELVLLYFRHPFSSINCELHEGKGHVSLMLEHITQYLAQSGCSKRA